MDPANTELSQIESREFFPGFHGKMVHTDDMTLAYWKIDAGATLQKHSHFHKQIVQVISGEFALNVDGVDYRCTAGTVFQIPGDVPHSGHAVTDCVIHDIFFPATGRLYVTQKRKPIDAWIVRSEFLSARWI